MIKKISSINRKSHKLLYAEKGHSFLKLKESQLSETTTWFANEQNVTVEQILGSEEIIVLKEQESVWDPTRKVNHLNKVVWN